MRSVSDERFFHTVKLLDTALLAAGEERDCDERFHKFYDAEASALAAASGGRRCEDPERRKVFAHSMTRKRQRWQPPPQVAAARPQGGSRAAAGRHRRTAAGRRRRAAVGRRRRAARGRRNSMFAAKRRDRARRFW